MFSPAANHVPQKAEALATVVEKGEFAFRLATLIMVIIRHITLQADSRWSTDFLQTFSLLRAL